MTSLPTEQEVFQCLCKEYGSSAAFSEIAERTDLFPHGSKSVETWLRKTKDSILVTEDRKGKITEVHAFSAHARLCLNYSHNGKCDNHDCTYLHICRDYMTNSCSRGVTCPLNHRFQNQRDRAWLSKINFDQFTDLQLQMLVLSSTPQICVKYNTDGKCKRGDSCTRIHMCHGYLRKCCSGGQCGLHHETAMDTDHTKAVLKRLMLNNVDKYEVVKMILDNELSLSDSDETMLNIVNEHEVVEMILDNELSLSENVTTECHIHQDRPYASICPQFLIGRCDKGSACSELHCSLPYHWQYKVSLFDEWKCFTDKDNLTLEKLYCDVNVETLVNFKPAQTLDLSHLKREGRLPHDLEYEVMINLDNMTITFQRPRGGEGFLAGLLRRLSTVSYVTWPYESMFTNWKWFWKDNGNVWQTYDKDCSKRDLQEQIEQAFQDKTKAMYQFTTSENVYNLFFDSTREMYQVNVRTGTKRKVKRRPEKPISDDDLNQWARGDSTSKRNVEERAAKTYVSSHVPSHWSSMPLNMPYTRVALDAASAEFQDVEKLFKQSMNGRAVIESIDRVQNPFIWEEYCRNKEKMMGMAQLLNQQQVNEKKLFHGTSPENVEAICEKNFDPRLHNKNKSLRFGQGTYFAVNALFSHSYAKPDSDLSQYMFLAKVLVGSYTKGHSSYRRPPPKDFVNVDTHLYDSCVNNELNPTIFVVFDANHFYPEYIIKYSSVRQPFSPPFALPLPVPFLSELASGHPIGTFNNLGTACNPSGSVARSSYSALTVSSSEVNGVNATASSNNLDTACSASRFASLSRYAAVAKANSAYCSSFQPRPTSLQMPKAPRVGFLHGILKHQSSSSNYLGKASLPSGSTTSTASGVEFTSTTPRRSSDNLDTASTQSGTAAESSYSASTLFSSELGSVKTRLKAQIILAQCPERSYAASNVSGSELTSVNPTRSTINLGSASTPSETAAESSYSASTTSSSELVSVNLTKCSDGLGTESKLGGTAAESSCSASVVTSSQLTSVNTSTSSNNLGSTFTPRETAAESRK